ncbi:MAG: hypothetical protein AAGA48_39325 [Myxococcota bacterium]
MPRWRLGTRANDSASTHESSPPPSHLGLRSVASSLSRYEYYEQLQGVTWTDDPATLAKFLRLHKVRTSEASVEFESEIAVFVTYSSTASCEAGIYDWQVWSTDGQPHVEVRVFDDSWGGGPVCDAAVHVVLVLAIPRGDVEGATVCLQVGTEDQFL